jgi:tetratricopeptide (TPR) repeat protein
LNNLAYSFAERGVKLDRALTLVDLALARDPKNSSYLDTKGWIYYRLGEFSSAMTLIKQALKYDHESPALLEHAGDVASAMNNRSRAIKYWRRALDLDPKSSTLPGKIGR